jgi:hypothetical protein
LNWGRLIPPLEGGIRYEFAHRVLAATVAVLVGVQAFLVRRKMAWWLLAAVLSQALLGGALVKLIDPKWMAMTHACLAQLCFGLAAAVLVELGGGGGVAQWAAVAGVFGQAVLGAAVRHKVMGAVPHMAGRRWPSGW